MVGVVVLPLVDIEEEGNEEREAAVNLSFESPAGDVERPAGDSHGRRHVSDKSDWF